MRSLGTLALALLCTLALARCGAQPADGTDVGSLDATVAAGLDAAASADAGETVGPDACLPLSCVGQCGAIPNGCGGTLDCAACPGADAGSRPDATVPSGPCGACAGTCKPDGTCDPDCAFEWTVSDGTRSLSVSSGQQASDCVRMVATDGIVTYAWLGAPSDVRNALSVTIGWTDEPGEQVYRIPGDQGRIVGCPWVSVWPSIWDPDWLTGVYETEMSGAPVPHTVTPGTNARVLVHAMEWTAGGQFDIELVQGTVIGSRSNKTITVSGRVHGRFAP